MQAVCTDTLANHLAVLKHDAPARITFLEDLHHTDVLVLDDFLTTPIDAATAHLFRRLKW